jgi:hypothetical protein
MGTSQPAKTSLFLEHLQNTQHTRCYIYKPLAMMVHRSANMTTKSGIWITNQQCPLFTPKGGGGGIFLPPTPPPPTTTAKPLLERRAAIITFVHGDF